ncbi:MAG: TonB-dependent receptor [Bacteroidetes bacterium]|nr:MAG: TonB-dependent receptor [Bacteroidota bacterium]
MRKSNHRIQELLFTIVLIILSAAIASAQITTATLSGYVKDSKGEALQSVTVTVEFADAGIKQIVITKSDGRFTVPNLRAGGPYVVTIEHVSYKKVTTENVVLDLGLNNSIDVVMEEKEQTIANVVVVARSSVFDNKRTGPSTNISNRQLRTMPSISRSTEDFLRFTPSASATYNGMSFAGRNGQYNNFSLDGAIFNNPFGLDAPGPGGQTNAQPISLDAIEQIQVNIAPYDITQAGFTGAGVNTVTKSGSNKFSGTAYAFYRTETFTGREVSGHKQVVPDLTQFQGGFAFGGALKKNKLFYFLSFETEQRTDEATSYVTRNASNGGNSNTSRVLESDMQAVRSILKSKFNYETGDYQGFTHNQDNYKWMAKLDWNINSVHKLAFTYNGLSARKEKPAHPSAIGRRGPDYTTLQFQNSGYEIVNDLHNFAAELKSNFKSGNANKLRVIYTTFRDSRNPFSAPFPVVNISKNNTRYIVAGHEPFSIYNRLNQDAFQATNDFQIFANKHTVTIGASLETFKFGNSFNLTGYGPTVFWDSDIQTFKDSVPVSGKLVFGAYPLDVDVNYARNRAVADRWSWYYLTVGQFALYGQDEWQVTPNFRMTLGLRIDKPIYFEKKFSVDFPNFNGDGTYAGSNLTASPTVQNSDNLTLFDKDGKPVTNGPGKDLDNTRLPTGKPLFSPRFGFNWDASGDKKFQIRGGSGLFSGRFPFVWLGNHIGNPFSFFYNATDHNFRWPQIWRSNLGIDIRTNPGWIITTDISYTKDVKAMMVRNYKLGTPTGTLNSGTGDRRNIYLAANQGAANAYVFTNTDVGYQFNWTLQLQRTFAKGLTVMAAYNYLVAKDASSISAEISSDAFDRNPILNNANEAILTPSLYGNTHRSIVAASRKFDYGHNKKWATTISLFGSWTSGNRFAYVYGGDINNDGTATNDLLYVPTVGEIDAMAFASLVDVDGNTISAAAQRQGLKDFILQDEYLSERRGLYTEKYGGVTPWYSQVDVRILQDLILSKEKGRSLQFSIDLVNLGNMINSNWGVRKYATTSGFYQPLSVNYNNNSPVYQFDPSNKSTFIDSPDLQSRWQLQFGLRYNF